jgi:hypothetical protein
MAETIILSPELLAELGPDALVSKKKKKKVNKEKGPKPKVPSKAHIKKMTKLKERKENKLRQKDYLQSIQNQAVSGDARKLLYSSANLGHTDTVRERVTREFLEKKAGIFVEGTHTRITSKHMPEIVSVTPDLSIEQLRAHQESQHEERLKAKAKKRSRATDFFDIDTPKAEPLDSKTPSSNTASVTAPSFFSNTIAPNGMANKPPMKAPTVKTVDEHSGKIVERPMEVKFVAPSASSAENDPSANVAPNPYKVNFRVAPTREHSAKKRKVLVGNGEAVAVELNTSNNSGLNSLSPSTSVTQPPPVQRNKTNASWRTVSGMDVGLKREEVYLSVNPSISTFDAPYRTGAL